MNTVLAGGAPPCRAEAAIRYSRRLVQDETQLRGAAGRDGRAARGTRPPRPRICGRCPCGRPLLSQIRGTLQR